MAIELDLNIGTLLVSSGVIVVPATGRWLWKQIEKKFDATSDHAEKHAKAVQEALDAYQETTQRALSRIETQTTKTNGRVTALELEAKKVEGILLGKELAK